MIETNLKKIPQLFTDMKHSRNKKTTSEYIFICFGIVQISYLHIYVLCERESLISKCDAIKL